MIAGAAPSLFEDREKDLSIEVDRNSDGGWNVHAYDENIRTLFLWTGVVITTGEIEVYGEYVRGIWGKVEGDAGRTNNGGVRRFQSDSGSLSCRRVVGARRKRSRVSHSRSANTFFMGYLYSVLVLGFILHAGQASSKRPLPPFKFWLTPKRTADRRF